MPGGRWQIVRFASASPLRLRFAGWDELGQVISGVERALRHVPKWERKSIGGLDRLEVPIERLLDCAAE